MEMPAVIVLMLALAFPAVATGVSAPDVIEGCYPLTLVDASKFQVPRFEDYAVSSTFKGKPAAPDVKTQARARRFRTMLRQGAAQGPNFAGHYTIVGWGCGTACVELAIVDAKTGRVVFPPGIRYVDVNFVELGPNEPEPEILPLRYRLDSRLLIVVGAPEEDDSRRGVTYYTWDGVNLKKLRFIRSLKKSCRDDRPIDAR